MALIPLHAHLSSTAIKPNQQDRHSPTDEFPALPLLWANHPLSHPEAPRNHAEQECLAAASSWRFVWLVWGRGAICGGTL